MNGAKILDKPFAADIIIINTCGFDKEREKTALDIIQKYMKRYYNKKEIIITGCLPKINESLNKIKGITTIGPREIEEFNKIFKSKQPIQQIKANRLNQKFCSNTLSFPKDYHIQISQGCINNCSYCAIKKAKGYIQSKPIKKIIKEFKKGFKLGFKRFVLLADDCGSYGVDINTDFAELLNKLHKATKKEFKLNLCYFEPSRLVKLYPKINKDVIKERLYFISIPLQSTSQRIIKLMNRNYNVKSVLKIVKEIKSLNPKIYLDSYTLYGFPSETREEFLDTFRLKDYFDKIIYLYYSDRENIKSSKLKNKITRNEIMYRTRLILQKSKKDKRFLLGYKHSNIKNILKSIKRDII